MPLNLNKHYCALLDLVSLGSQQNMLTSVRGVFHRDIENNPNFRFRTKQIKPVQKAGGNPDMEVLFDHLTNKAIYDNGRKIRDEFDLDRCQRLHWIKHHIDELHNEGIEVFSYQDRIKGYNYIRTYIFDTQQDYVIVLEPMRNNDIDEYYFITAYYFNELGGKENIERKMARRLPQVH